MIGVSVTVRAPLPLGAAAAVLAQGVAAILPCGGSGTAPVILVGACHCSCNSSPATQLHGYVLWVIQPAKCSRAEHHVDC
jgi:hypothetical protein